jgi:hypothetical protein
MSLQALLFLHVPVLDAFWHLPWHSFFTIVLSVLATGPLANTVALANNIATTPKLNFFIFL